MSDIAQEFRILAESFSHIIQGLAYLDEDEAGRMAKKYSERLVLNARSVYKELGEEIAVVMAKPPKKRRKSRKAVEGPVFVPNSAEVPDNVDDIRNQSMVASGEGATGVEELPDNTATSLINRQVDPDNMGMEVENLQQTLNSNVVTNRSGNQRRDGRIAPQKRLP
jgi:hypothetical protein